MFYQSSQVLRKFYNLFDIILVHHLPMTVVQFGLLSYMNVIYEN